MDKKNLMPQAGEPFNRTTTGELPAQLAQLSEEALQQIIGGDIAIVGGAEPVIDTYFLVRVS
jgi:bacteriocin leader peptide (microcyclamide/patellamide family)